MIKQFLKDSAVYGISGIATRAISIFLVPFYTRVFTPADYGVIDLIAVISSVVSVVIPLEITQGVARFYPDAKPATLSRAYASTALYFTLVSFFGFLLLVLLLAPILEGVFKNAVSVEIIRVSALSMFANGLFYFVQNQLRWRLEPKRHALCSIVFSVLSLGLTVVFVLVMGSGVIGVFLAQSIAGVTAFFLGLFLSRSSYEVSFQRGRLSEMLSFCGPLVPSSLGIFVLTYADRISITSIMTLADLGVFGIGYRIASVVSVIMVGFQGAITPLIYARYKDDNTPSELARLFRSFVFGALIIASGLSIFSREILMILTMPQYYSAGRVIPFLVVATFLSSMYVFMPGLAIAKKTKVMALINFLGALLNILLNLFLIPLYGIAGAALSTLISSAAIFGTNMYLSQQHYHIPHDAKKLLYSTAVVVVLGVIGYYIGGASLILTITGKVIVFVGMIAILISLRLVSIEEIKHTIVKIRMSMS